MACGGCGQTYKSHTFLTLTVPSKGSSRGVLKSRARLEREKLIPVAGEAGPAAQPSGENESKK